MAKKKKPLSWILTKVPDKDLGWAIGYLERKGMNQLLTESYQTYPINWGAPPREALRQVVELFNSNIFRHNNWRDRTDSLMKQAWRAKQTRAGAKGYKPYSFSMKHEVAPALGYLARTYNLPINQVLESLILRNANQLKEEESPLRKEIRNLQAALKQSGREPPSHDHLSEIAILKKTIKAQWGIIERLQFQYEHLLVLTGDPDLQQPTDEQRILINLRCKELLEFHQRELSKITRGILKQPPSQNQPL